jgi:DNA excision repair protein ERCC-6
MVRSVLSGETASPLTAISYLKQLCGHPSLIRDDRDAIVDNRPSHILLEESAKLQVLFSLMKRLKRAGHRALVFSQSTKMLDIIERVFDGTFAFLRIDGQTEGKTRQRYVDDFNDKDSGIDCMLLSTKAAGVGLTLNGANRGERNVLADIASILCSPMISILITRLLLKAIIYDPSWNPAEDCQAVDRCYRIGQSKNVTVYRMIVSGTVEEKMYEKQGARHTALFSSPTYVVTNIQRDTRIAVHKDGIKRVLLMESAGATKRYFDKADLSDLFKLAPADAPCSMLEKFHDKEKQSFLSKDPNVIGVASHDVLYNNAVGDGSNDNNAVDLTTSSSKTPFSREPFKNSAPITSPSIADAPIADVEIVEVEEPQNLMPLGRGLNRTRENRVNAKARRNDEVKETAKSNESSTVDDALSIATHHMSNNEYANAIDVMLELLENRSNAIQSDAKLKVHENIAFAASKLGWL